MGWLPSPQEVHPALGPSGLQLWLFGPCSLPPQMRSPNLPICSELNLFYASPILIPYNVIIVNPNSLRPYHTTFGPAAGPTCSQILAPSLPQTPNINMFVLQREMMMNTVSWLHLLVMRFGWTAAAAAASVLMWIGDTSITVNNALVLRSTWVDSFSTAFSNDLMPSSTAARNTR